MKRILSAVATVALATLCCVSSNGQGKWPPHDQQVDIWSTFNNSLAGSCPTKRLDWLPYADLNLIIERYSEHLAASQNRRIEAAVKRSCSGVDMGISCANVGFLYDAIHYRYLDQFVQFACSQPNHCAKRFQCVEQ